MLWVFIYGLFPTIRALSGGKHWISMEIAIPNSPAKFSISQLNSVFFVSFFFFFKWKKHFIINPR